MCNQVLDSSVRWDDYKWFIFIFFLFKTSYKHLSILGLFLVVYLYLSILGVSRKQGTELRLSSLQIFHVWLLNSYGEKKKKEYNYIHCFLSVEKKKCFKFPEAAVELKSSALLLYQIYLLMWVTTLKIILVASTMYSICTLFNSWILLLRGT